MRYYESDQLFRAISDARERSASAAPALHEGLEELLTIVLLAGVEVPDRLDRLIEVGVDCSPDVRPVINSTLASLLARPAAEQRAIAAAARRLLKPAKPANDPFADLFKL